MSTVSFLKRLIIKKKNIINQPIILSVLIGLIFFISFSSNLSISPIGKIIVLKNILALYFNFYFSIFNSLYFSCILVFAFLITKDYSSPLKIGSFAYCLTIFVFIIWIFHPHIFFEKFLKTKVLYLKQFSDLRDFKRFIKYSYKVHNSYISYNLPKITNVIYITHTIYIIR